jgi:hypothetical protein
VDFDAPSAVSLLGIPGLAAEEADSRLLLGTDLEHDTLSQSLFEDGDAIESLISSLESPENLNSTLNSDKVDTQSIMKQARDFTSRQHITPAGVESPEESERRLEPASDFKNSDDDITSDEDADEEEAAKYVERLLEQLDSDTQNEHRDSADLQNVNSPSQNPDQTPRSSTTNDEDDLSSRLTALNLPSDPSDLPGSKKTLRKDNDVPDCCCICYDNATTKCLDCEGDQLFCVRCWWEMHTSDGTDAGDHQHRTVKYQP